jgi:hypothetical protein
VAAVGALVETAVVGRLVLVEAAALEHLAASLAHLLVGLVVEVVVALLHEEQLHQAVVKVV